MRNRRGQSGLWGYAISGDLPIVLLQISKAASIDLVRQLVQAHAYWRLKGLAVDLVIWNEDHDRAIGSNCRSRSLGLDRRRRRSAFRRSARRHLRAARRADFERRPSAVRIRGARDHLRHARHAGRAGQPPRPADVRVPRLTPTRTHRPEPPLQPHRRRPDPCSTGSAASHPTAANTSSRHRQGEATPAPWVNVLANPNFGTVVSESGAAYTWSENAHLYPAHAMAQRPVGEASGEALYIRDEETGHFWSPHVRVRCRGRPRARLSPVTASATACSSTSKTASTRS